MLEHCRRTFPRAKVELRDIRDLDAYEPGSFEAVVAPFNVLDVLGDEERGAVLDGIHRSWPRTASSSFARTTARPRRRSRTR